MSHRFDHITGRLRPVHRLDYKEVFDMSLKAKVVFGGTTVLDSGGPGMTIVRKVYVTFTRPVSNQEAYEAMLSMGLVDARPASKNRRRWAAVKEEKL
jgi:hypothetical protein